MAPLRTCSSTGEPPSAILATAPQRRRSQQRARELWVLYTPSLANLPDLCQGCPPLNLGSLVKELKEARALGTGDYELPDVLEMSAQRYAPLVLGDFNHDGGLDIALIGRGEKNGKPVAFLMLASRHRRTFRRLYFKHLEWPLAALRDDGDYVVLTSNYYPSDDFWFFCWTGKTFDLRYIGDFMDSAPCPRRGGAKTPPTDTGQPRS